MEVDREIKNLEDIAVLKTQQSNMADDIKDMKARDEQNWQAQRKWNRTIEKKLDKVLSSVENIENINSRHNIQHNELVASSLESKPVRDKIENIVNTVIVRSIFGKSVGAKIIRAFIFLATLALIANEELLHALVNIIKTTLI